MLSDFLIVANLKDVKIYFIVVLIRISPVACDLLLIIHY